MKRRVIPLLLAAVLLTGCTAPAIIRQKQYTATFLTLFDTVTTIIGYAGTEEEFRAYSHKIQEELLKYHQLFDIYNDYEGVNNLKTINDNAGKKAVQVDEEIIRLLLDCREFYEATDGKVNVAMGSVLSLWHETRTAGIEDPQHAEIPDKELLKEAALHTDFDSVVIDETNFTVFLADPQQRLDVGAVAKGWAAEQVCREMPSGFLISVGGNVCATGPKPQNDAPWVIGIQDPDNSKGAYLHTVNVTDGCVVTSGDYQRYYVVDGRRYHHIIDPETNFPAEHWRSVSILCDDSGLADALSTALFLISREEGQEILDQYDACAMWVDLEGEIYYSSGFEEHIKQ